MQTVRCITVLAVWLTIATATKATSWRVNNFSNYNGTVAWGDNMGGTAQYPVFRQIDQAVNSSLVASGDTLYVEASTLMYDAGTLTKRLVIIGAGYLLDENLNNSVLPQGTTVSAIVFSAGSTGSRLMGVRVFSGINIFTPDIVVKRCYLEGGITLQSGAYYGVRIEQNYFPQSTGFALWGATVNDIVFNNNIVRKRLDVTEFQFLEIYNNVFDPPNLPVPQPSIRVYTSSFQNNILKNPTAIVSINDGNMDVVSYNIAASPTQFGTGNNNIVADMAALFVDAAGNSSDGAYQLKPGSAAGSDGTDRGAFGGANPLRRYVLSGLPAVPVIYSLETTGVATSTGMPVEIKAKAIQ